MAKPLAILACRDLIFESKIKGTADAMGIALVVVPGISRVGELCSSDTRLVLLDLSDSGTTAEAIRSLRATLPELARLVAFGSHVETERLKEARAAGCDPVLPRSEFTARLPMLLQLACE